MSISRRRFVAASLLAASSAMISARQNSAAEQGAAAASRRPILHQTDLFHPHGDPDDHFDLATLFALHLRGDASTVGVLLDYPPQHRKGDPDVLALAQMNRLCAASVPAAVGTEEQMKTPNDPMENLAAENLAGVNLILDTLRAADQSTAITCVGSATDIAVAALRQPKLFAEKCSGVYLNSGSAFSQPDQPDLLEWNVRLNPSAYATLFTLPCPLYWFPCWDIVEQRVSGQRGTFYWLPHAEAFEGISDRLKNFFLYMFDQTESPKWLDALRQKPNEESWNRILTDRRGMWSTASLLYAAEQTVTRSGEIVPIADLAESDTLYRMKPVEVTCDADGRTHWKESSESNRRFMFHLLAPDEYPPAMTRAVHTLLKEF